MKRRTILIAAGALLASSCFIADFLGPGPQAIRGTVYRGNWPEAPTPAAGVSVRLHSDPPRVVTTALDGRFSFHDLPVGKQFNVTLDLEQGSSHPAGISGGVAEGYGDSEGYNFTILPGAGHRLEGTVSGAPGALISTCCASSSHLLVGSDGTFAIENLPFQSYEVRAGILNSATKDFTPEAVTVQAILDFEHSEAGNGTLGPLTVISVLAGAADVSGCFDVQITGDGTGTIRPKSDVEIPVLVCAPFYEIWNAGTNVVVTLGSDLGPSTITLDLYWCCTMQSSSTSFALTERLVPSASLHFTRNAP